ncbi:hypothetical protein [Paraconexibacter sp.]|uniref:hypothetical protein n=1 Tax=Paraconexibacter sp. TaxID=2949640 RepID=UPI003565F9F3
MVLAFGVVYGVIAAEIWMWTAASTAAVAVTLALIIVVAGLICRSAVALLADGVTTPTVAETAESVGIPSSVTTTPTVDVTPLRPRSSRPRAPHPA